MENQIPELTSSLKRHILEDRRKFKISPRTDDEFLARFIRMGKYDTTAALALAQQYYQNIYENMDSLEGLRSASFTHIYDMNIFRYFKQKLNGILISYWSAKHWDTSVVSYRDLSLAVTFLEEELLQDPQFQVNGSHVIIDFSHFEFSHVRQLTYHNVKFSVKVAQDRFSIPVAGVHFVNYPRIFRPLFQLITSLLPRKVKSRIHHHNGFQSLAKIFPLEILPESLGGAANEAEAWNNTIVSKLQTKNICYDSYWKCEGNNQHGCQTKDKN